MRDSLQPHSPGVTGRAFITDAKKLLEMMDNDPHTFLLHSSEKDLIPFSKFYHRTFNGVDCLFFIDSLKNIYREYPVNGIAFPC